MRSHSVEQLVLFFLIVGLPLLKSIVDFIRKRNPSSAEPRSAPGDDDGETSWLRGNEQDLLWSRGDEKSASPAPLVTPPPAPRAASKVAPSTLRTSVWQAAPAPAERPVPSAGPRKKHSPQPSARPAALSALRQIPRDHFGQRRAIVLMAVFGPPRALDPPP